jgi:hypothetical protein
LEGTTKVLLVMRADTAEAIHERLHDDPWTNLDCFELSPSRAGRYGLARSPVGPEVLLSNHRRNTVALRSSPNGNLTP